MDGMFYSSVLHFLCYPNPQKPEKEGGGGGGEQCSISFNLWTLVVLYKHVIFVGLEYHLF